jgi:hypothetical protein
MKLTMIYILTLHAPLSPDDVVKADFVFYGQMHAPERLPFWRCQLPTTMKIISTIMCK